MQQQQRWPCACKVELLIAVILQMLCSPQCQHCMDKVHLHERSASIYVRTRISIADWHFAHQCAVFQNQAKP